MGESLDEMLTLIVERYVGDGPEMGGTAWDEDGKLLDCSWL